VWLVRRGGGGWGWLLTQSILDVWLVVVVVVDAGACRVVSKFDV
jgi:hypothetical protein